MIKKAREQMHVSNLRQLFFWEHKSNEVNLQDIPYINLRLNCTFEFDPRILKLVFKIVPIVLSVSF